MTPLKKAINCIIESPEYKNRRERENKRCVCVYVYVCVCWCILIYLAYLYFSNRESSNIHCRAPDKMVGNSSFQCKSISLILAAGANNKKLTTIDHRYNSIFDHLFTCIFSVSEVFVGGKH